MKKISVIVPVYNVEKYLPKCIESILAQSYTAIELILVDDGSKDQSGSICNMYAIKDSRIKVIHQDNKGMSGARNTGLDIAQGDYIGFVDSDDYIHHNMYTLMVQAIEKNNAAIAACKINSVSESGRIIRNLNKNNRCQILPTLNREEALSVFPSNNVISYSVCDKLFSAFFIKNIRFDSKVWMLEDCLFVCEALFNINTIVIIPHPLYFYVIRKGSILHSDFNIKYLDAIEAKKKCIRLYEENQPDLAKFMVNSLISTLFYTLVCATEGKAAKKTIADICLELNKYKDCEFSGRLIDHIRYYVYFKLNSIKLMMLLGKIKRIIKLFTV